jgi:hypothetical protein
MDKEYRKIKNLGKKKQSPMPHTPIRFYLKVKTSECTDDANDTNIDVNTTNRFEITSKWGQ